MSTKKFLLEEKDIPTAWYNIVADMKNKPLPILNPQTKTALKGGRFISSILERRLSSRNEHDRHMDRDPR